VDSTIERVIDRWKS